MECVSRAITTSSGTSPTSNWRGRIGLIRIRVTGVNTGVKNYSLIHRNSY